MYQKYFKRLFNIIFSLILILILFPLMFLIWIFIGFPIFTKVRIILNNKLFNVYKFKTLYDHDPSKNILEEKRQNKLGNFLRKTGLDELLQLYNVIKNDMSLVGPRPLSSEYLKKYTNYEKRRHHVKAGITGLAQINPESSGIKSWDKSIKLDISYLDNISFFLDIKILFKAVLLVLLKKKPLGDFNIV